MKDLLRSASVLALLAAGLAARAIVLYDNLATPYDVSDPIAGAVESANRFATGALPSSLTGVTLGAAGPSGLSLALYADANDRLGARLEALGSGVASCAGQLAFGGNALPLAAKARYWIVASNASAFSTWSYTDSDANAGSNPAAAEGYAASADSGATWHLVVGPGSFPYHMAVTAQPTPEPSAVAALGLGASSRSRGGAGRAEEAWRDRRQVG